MSTISARIAKTPVHIFENHFSLTVEQHARFTAIDMELFLPIVTTKNIPLTFDILHSELPSIMQSKCFNENNIPFATELKTTEMGHLFEHILLEYLCEEKLARGYTVVEYSGETDWNWIKDPRGTFHITISTTQKDTDIFSPALQKTIKLFNTILHTESVMYTQYLSQDTSMNHPVVSKALSN